MTSLTTLRVVISIRRTLRRSSCGSTGTRASRDFDVFEDLPDDLLAVDAVGFRLEGDQDPVAEDVVRDRLDVLRGHEAPVLDERVGAARFGERDRRARGGADLDLRLELGEPELFREARGEDDAEDVVLELLV